VIHLVFGTLRAARVANFGAELADLGREFGVARHFTFGKRADVGAATIQLDATGHHLHIFLVQTRRSTMFAGFDAVMASFDTIFIFFVGHIDFSFCAAETALFFVVVLSRWKSSTVPVGLRRMYF